MPTDQAREYLDYYASVPRRGPFLLDPDAVRAQQFANLAESLASAVPRDAEELIWHAPSAWDAGVFLLWTTRFFAEYESPGAPIFRGQRDPNWPVVSSIYRTANANRTPLDAFCGAMAGVTWEEVTDASRATYIASAQHYGLETSLLDFTTDPLIAIYFASLGATEGSQVVVYWLSFNLALSLGVSLVLAPPWVRRHHIQRGLFLDIELDLKPVCYRILFPVSAEFQTWLGNYLQSEVLPENDWLARACAWARAYEGPIPAPPEDANAILAKQLTDKIGPPPFMVQSIEPNAGVHTVRQFEDLCNWLSLHNKSESESIQLRHRCLPLLVLRESNPGFFLALRGAQAWMTKNNVSALPQYNDLLSAIERCDQENQEKGGKWSSSLQLEK